MHSELRGARAKNAARQRCHLQESGRFPANPVGPDYCVSTASGLESRFTDVGNQDPSHWPRNPACSSRIRALQGPNGQRKSETTFTVSGSSAEPLTDLIGHNELKLRKAEQMSYRHSRSPVDQDIESNGFVVVAGLEK